MMVDVTGIEPVTPACKFRKRQLLTSDTVKPVDSLLESVQ
jgi:hypothetical protein